MPVDGSMVPLAEALTPLGSLVDGMIDGRGDIAAEHTEEIERDAQTCPAVLSAEAHNQKDDAEGYTQDDASCV